jgi:RNA recognition motif-containing protein
MPFRDMLNSFITGEALEGIDVPDLPVARKESVEASASSSSSGLQLWIENLPWDVKDEELRTYFQSVGPVESCEIQRRSDGKSRGTAIVRFTSPKDANTAIETLDGTEIGDRPIRVRLDRRG